MPPKYDLNCSGDTPGGQGSIVSRGLLVTSNGIHIISFNCVLSLSVIHLIVPSSSTCITLYTVPSTSLNVHWICIY